MLKPQLHIGTATQFQTFGPVLPVDRQRKDLFAGLGVIVFEGPQGPGFYKGGHDEQTANTLVCSERSQRCVLFSQMTSAPRLVSGSSAMLQRSLMPQIHPPQIVP